MWVEEKTIHGRWWIPEKPDVRVSGFLEIQRSGSCQITLIFDEENGLEAFVGTSQFHEIFPFKKVDHLIINGLLYDGQYVSARSVACFFKEVRFGTIYEFSCHLNYICFSKVDIGMDDLKLDEVILDIAGVDDFIFTTGFEREDDETFKTNQESKKISINYRPPAPIEIFNDGKISLYAKFRYTHSFSRFAPSITQKTKFELVSKKSMPLDEWLDDIISLNQLICVLFGQPLPLLSIESFKVVDDKEENLSFLIYSEPTPQKEVFPNHSNLIFKFHEVGNKGGALIQNFIELRKTYKLVFDNFFASKFANDQYILLRFFMIIRALEGLHRQLWCDNISTNNAPSLRTRLDEIFCKFERIYAEPINCDEIIRKIVKYRNQEAHLGDTAYNYDITEIFKITQVLHTIFTVLFLEEAAEKAEFTIPPKYFQNTYRISRNIKLIEEINE